MCTFNAGCPRCGSVSLAAEQIELRIFADGSGEDCYAFTCPICHQRIRKSAGAGVVRVLRAGGVQPTECVAHPETPPSGLPPVTHEDLLEFHELLQGDDWLASHLV